MSKALVCGGTVCGSSVSPFPEQLTFIVKIGPVPATITIRNGSHEQLGVQSLVFSKYYNAKDIKILLLYTSTNLCQVVKNKVPMPYSPYRYLYGA